MSKVKGLPKSKQCNSQCHAGKNKLKKKSYFFPHFFSKNVKTRSIAEQAASHCKRTTEDEIPCEHS
jgi:hypothetical protein